MADALTSDSFSGEVCLVLTVGFVLLRLNMSGGVESEEAIYDLNVVSLGFLYMKYANKCTYLSVKGRLSSFGFGLPTESSESSR